MSKSLKLVILVVVLLNIVSCVSYEKLRYFDDIQSFGYSKFENPRYLKKISPFDNLYIKILSTDEKTSRIFNSVQDFPSSGVGMSSMMGYLVNESGEISLPFIGRIKVGGYTTFESCKIIETALNEYLPNTSVIVRFIDNKVTVMGEVARPGIIQFSDEQVNIYQALAMAGGLTRYGNRKEVILVRHEGNHIEHYQLDLTNAEIAANPNYYIQPNDVVIVEPIRAVSWTYPNTTYTTILGTLTTMVTIVLAIMTFR